MMKTNLLCLFGVIAMTFGLVSCDSGSDKPAKSLSIEVPAPIPNKEIDVDMTQFLPQKSSMLRAAERVLWEGVIATDFAAEIISVGGDPNAIKGMKIREMKLSVISPASFPLGFLSDLRIYAGAGHKLIAEGQPEAISSSDMKITIVEDKMVDLLVNNNLPIKITTTREGTISDIPGGNFPDLKILKLNLQTKASVKVELK